jgi:hypothetical protein
MKTQPITPHPCEYCGTTLQRRKYDSGRLERLSAYAARHYCNPVCRGKALAGTKHQTAGQFQAKPYDISRAPKSERVTFALLLHYLDAVNGRCKEMGVKPDMDGFLRAVGPEIRRVLTGPGRVTKGVMQWEEQTGQNVVYMSAHNYARARRDVGLRVV